jgi:hypothetical protein
MKTRPFLIASLGLYLTACNTVQIIVERTPTPSASALATEPRLTLTHVAITETPTLPATTPAPDTDTPAPPTPTSVPTSTPTTRLPAISASATPLPAFLSASPAQIRPGEAITLTWSVPVLDMAGYGYGLSPYPPDLTQHLGWDFVSTSSPAMPASGSMVITTSTELNRVTTQLEFQLSLWSKPPGQATSILDVVTTTVQVLGEPVCSEAWFFDNPPTYACPSYPPIYSNAATERFEHGRMIWVEVTDVFYIFFDPVGQNKAVFQQFAVPLALKPGASADNRVGETPPAGLVEPVSGFGLLWRGEVEGADNVRAALGWAVEPEYAYDTAVQCEATFSSNWSCYLLGPANDVINFYNLTYIGLFWDEG